MKIKDSDVGVIWRDAHKPAMNLYWVGKCIDLIGKLVEERAINLASRGKKGAIWTDEEMAAAVSIALREFGIPKEDWRNRNG